jgi:hypothetical protein
MSELKAMSHPEKSLIPWSIFIYSAEELNFGI